MDIDKAERFYVDYGWSLKRIGRRLGEKPSAVKHALLAVGLEIEGEALPPREPSSRARCGNRAKEV